MVNLIIKAFGLGWLWEAVDGKKTYISALLGLLTGVAGLAQEFVPPVLAHDGGKVLDLVKHLPSDQSWLAVVAALGVFGLRHGVEKAGNP